MPKSKQVYRNLILLGKGNSKENTVSLLPRSTAPPQVHTPVDVHTKRGLKGEDRGALLTICCRMCLPAGVVGRILVKNMFRRGKDTLSFITQPMINSRHIFPLPFSLYPRGNNCITLNVVQSNISVIKVIITKGCKMIRVLSRNFLSS